MPELIALDLDGQALVDALLRVWDAGDAALPLDPHAPAAHTRRVLDSLAPAAVIGADGERRTRPGGVPVEPGDAVVVATSGTTGAARGAVHTHDGIAEAARITAAATGSGPGSDARWLACLPLAHVGGLSVVTRALAAGVDLEVHERAEASRIGDAARRGATHVSLVATLLGRIDADLWRLILLGGGTTPADRPPNAVATYGLTETFGGVVYDGRPLDGVEVRVTDPDDAGVGTVELRTPTAMRAYRHDAGGSADPAGTDPRTPDRWLRTGDLGRLDTGSDPRQVRLHIEGRSDDLIITGGSKVWPEPVERMLATHPAVAEVAVVGAPDPEWGQRVVALVVPRRRDAPPPLDELRSLVRGTLPVAAAPKEVRVLDVLPRTALGKIKRYTLLEAIRMADPNVGT